MSVHDIAQFRKEGNFEAAFNMAKEELEADPSNEWIQMAMFWVLRDICLHQYIPNKQEENFHKALLEMGKLLPTMKDENGYGQRAFESLKRQMQPQFETIDNAANISKTDAQKGYELVQEIFQSSKEIDSTCHEQLGWILFRYIRQMIGILSSVEIRRLLSYYIKLKNNRPSILHTQILRQALKFSQNNPDFNFYKFLLLWNPEQLNREDFEKSQYEGHEVKPFVNRIFNQLVNGHYEISVDRLSESFDLPINVIVEYLRESYFWKLWALWNSNRKKEYFDDLLDYCDHYSIYGPSHWHSEILRKALHSFVDQDEVNFIYFFQKWDFHNLREEDWQTSQDQHGHTYPSTAESAAKKCFNSVKNMSVKSESILRWLSDFFDNTQSHLNENEWMIRNRAIIYLWENKKEEAILFYKNTLLKLSDKFYIWSELSKCVEENDLKIGLLSKALLLEHNQSFLGEIHLNLASLLIEKKLYSNALLELNCYKEKRDSEGWNISKNYELLLQSIPQGTQASRNNNSLYYEYSEVADEFAFSDIPTEKFVFLERWEKEGKKRCTLINKEGIRIQVNERRFTDLRKSQVGKIFDVKYMNQVGEGRVVPLIIKISKEQDLSTILPHEYGYVGHINEDRKIAHINSTSGTLFFYPINQSNIRVSKGDFVNFYTYSSTINNVTRNYVINLNVSDASQALEYFKKRIVVVDNINEERKLIHYQAGPGLIDGVIYFDKMSIRPLIGDLLEITYYISKDKSGRKKRNVLAVNKIEGTNVNLRKTITGHLTLHYNEYDEEPGYAFIDDCYVHKSILKKCNIDSDCEVTAEVICGRNGQWQTISIETI